jgi:hypothetical protein
MPWLRLIGLIALETSPGPAMSVTMKIRPAPGWDSYGEGARRWA